MTKAATKRRAAREPKGLGGSAAAKRQAVVVLEVLSGERSAGEGSHRMGVSVSRYYALEARALQGLIAALEPRPKGKRRSVTSERDGLLRDKRRLEREVGRLQALVRASQRALGIPASGATEGGKPSGRGKAGEPKRRRTMVRAARAIAVLQAEEASALQCSESGSGAAVSSSGAASPPYLGPQGR